MFPTTQALFDDELNRCHVGRRGHHGTLSGILAATGCLFSHESRKPQPARVNISGLNSGSHRDPLRGVVSEANASIVCVQETKLSVISLFLINEMLEIRLSRFAYLPSDGASRGVLIACRSPDFSLTTLSIWKFSMSVLVQANDDIEPWCLTSVYGPQTNADKVEWLDKLRAIQTSITCPWLIARDFNLILYATDKTNMNLNR